MYKLWNYIFGWDYIYWSNFCSQGIKRVRITPDGELYYYRYSTLGLIDKIESADQVIWLTCKSDKYFNNG